MVLTRTILEVLKFEVGYPLIDHAKVTKGEIHSFFYTVYGDDIEKLSLFCKEHRLGFRLQVGNLKTKDYFPGGCVKLVIFMKGD